MEKILKVTREEDPKIFEVHSNLIDCFVCAKDQDHVVDVLSLHLEESVKAFVFYDVKEIPVALYHNFTMEREGQEGTEMLNFNTYIDGVRGSDDWEVVCTIDAP
jgi:hypothetical protein